MGNVDLRRLDGEGKRTFRNCAIDWKNWKAQLDVIAARLASVMIYEKDVFEFIDLMDAPECLQYIDPPYQHGTRSATRYAVEFDRHAELAERLVSCKSMVVLSGYQCPEYAVLEAAGFVRVEKDYRANMSLTRRTECLWISPNALAARRESRPTVKIEVCDEGSARDAQNNPRDAGATTRNATVTDGPLQSL